MGYSTYFGGEFKITPPLTKPEYERLMQIADWSNSEEVLKAAKADVFRVDPVAELTPADETFIDTYNHRNAGLDYFTLMPDKIEADGEDARDYGVAEAFTDIARWLQENGHQLAGAISWDGEESGDRGTIWAECVNGKNLVEEIQDIITEPLPSWKNGEDVTIKLKRNDAGQLLDGLRMRLESWDHTAKHYGWDYCTESCPAAEECRDENEARQIAAHYREIIAAIEAQL